MNTELFLYYNHSHQAGNKTFTCAGIPCATISAVITVSEGLKKYWWVIVLLIAAYLFYRHKQSKKQHDDAPTASA